MLSNNEILKMIFGFKVRYLRQKEDLSYQELSAITSLSTSYLNDSEIPSTANLVPWYSEPKGNVILPPIEEILIMIPLLL